MYTFNELVIECVHPVHIHKHEQAAIECVHSMVKLWNVYIQQSKLLNMYMNLTNQISN